VPADADALAGRPSGDVRRDRIDPADDLMPRNAGVGNVWKTGASFFDQRVAVADAACLDPDPHSSGRRLRNFPLYQFKGPIRASDLNGAHLWHVTSNDDLLHHTWGCRSPVQRKCVAQFCTPMTLNGAQIVLKIIFATGTRTNGLNWMPSLHHPIIESASPALGARQGLAPLVRQPPV
jgi:hypothetical protein